MPLGLAWVRVVWGVNCVAVPIGGRRADAPCDWRGCRSCGVWGVTWSRCMPWRLVGCVLCPMRCAIVIGWCGTGSRGCRLVSLCRGLLGGVAFGCVWCRCAVGLGGWRVVLLVLGVAVSCRVMSCHVVSCCVVSRCVVSCRVVSRCVVSRCVVSCRVALRRVALCRVVSRCVVSCRVISCRERVNEGR